MENPRSSLGNPRESDMFSLSNTEHLRRNAQSCIRTSSPVLRQLHGNLHLVSLEIQPQWSGLLARIVSDLVECAKNTLVLYGA
jgi:hypothetical protein